MRNPIELPKPLPKSADEFEAFAERIFNTFAIEPSDVLKGTLATMIMHLGPTESTARDGYFGAALKKQIANDVAYAKIREINEKLKAEAAAKQEAQAAKDKSEAKDQVSDESIPVAPV